MKGNIIAEILKKTRSGKKVTESELLRKLNTGKTILEYCLERNRRVNCDRIEKSKSLNIIFKSKKFYLLKCTTLKALFKPNPSSDSERYIDTLIRLSKSDKSINMTLYNVFNDYDSLYEVADLYLLYAQNNLLSYLYPLDKDALLLEEDKRLTTKEKYHSFFFDNDKKPKKITFLEILLEKNRKLTMDKLLPKNDKRDLEVSVILGMKNIEISISKLDFMKNRYIEQLEATFNDNYEKIPLKKEHEEILRMLYEAYSDNSEQKALIALINAYRASLSNNEHNTLNEIQQLLLIKKHNPNFSFTIEDESYYNFPDNKVVLKYAFPSIIAHEVGHALFHNLTDGEVPEEFYELLDKVRRDPGTLKKAETYSEEMHKMRADIMAQIVEIYDMEYPEMDKILELNSIRYNNRKFFDVAKLGREDELVEETAKARRQIKSFLVKTKEEKRKELLEKGYDKELIDTILDNTFTISEYILQHKKIQKREMLDAVLGGMFEAERSYGDFFDGIYRGHFLDRKLKNEKGQTIRGSSGHGLWYYNVNDTNVFDEMLANYSVFLKTPDSEKYIKKLRYFIGDELVDFIIKYYNDNIVHSNHYQKGDLYARNR